MACPRNDAAAGGPAAVIAGTAFMTFCGEAAPGKRRMRYAQ